jgi:hypothetical protein
MVYLQTTYELCFGKAYFEYFESWDFSRENTNIDVSVFMFDLRMINMSSECEYDWYWKISACSTEYEVCDSWQPEPLNRNESGRFGALKSDSTHYFFRNACTKSGSLRFSQFSGCWLILSVYIIMSFDFPFVRLFGVR